MTDFRDRPSTSEQRSASQREAGAGSDGLHRELQMSATSIADHLRNANGKDHNTAVRELNAALIEFRDEILNLEKSNKNVAANEREFLQALTNQQDLHGMGFPKLHLTQNGEKLSISADIKEANGSVDSSSYQFDWTSFTKDEIKNNPALRAKHELTGANFMQALQPKLDQERGTGTEAPPAVPEPAQKKANMLTGRVDDQQVNLSTGETQYPHPKMVYDGNVQQAQPHFRYTGDVQVSGDVIHVNADDRNLPKGTTWLDVTDSKLYHSAYGYFEQVNNPHQGPGQPRFTERFHILQVSTFDRNHAPGRPVTVPQRGQQWVQDLEAYPE